MYCVVTSHLHMLCFSHFLFVHRIRLLDHHPLKTAANIMSIGVKIVVYKQGNSKWGLNVNEWSDVKCGGVEWTDVKYVKWFYFEVKWVTVKFLGTKVSCTLGWPYTEGTWLYCECFVWCVSCTVVVFNLFCNMWVSVCVGVLVICVLVLSVFCIVCTVFLYCLYYVFVLFVLCFCIVCTVFLYCL